VAKALDGRYGVELCGSMFGLAVRRHHSAFNRVPARCLTEANWEFINDVLGGFGRDYVRRRYAR
jgi:hypothetical protein